jgi:hypothetical protein
MIDPLKQNQAPQALHRILIEARLMAYEGQDSAKLADVLDWAELLPGLLAAEEDKTSEYRSTLAAIAECHPRFTAALSAFESGERVRW